MDEQEWVERGESAQMRRNDNESMEYEIADLNATLCFMMADLIRLLDQPFRRVPGPR